ncbi:MAG TPA: 3-oxoadipate enol-lactonase [Acetobacteraceae bacterium]|nr:3-oxoadipate enol-lactonase [Acetobacteraceae bacterium]
MFLRIHDATVHVALDGLEGAPPVLLLHSLGTEGRVWQPQAAALAGRYRVIRPDLRGHGLSGVTAGPGSMARFAADAVAVLDALGIARAHVGGLSIGGMVAQALAAQAPDRVASLMLCDTAMMIPPASLWRERAATVRAQGMPAIAEGVVARWVTPAALGAAETEGLRTMLLRTPPEGYAAAAEAIAAADLSASTAQLRLPALVLVGAEDVATPPAAAAALAAAIPGAALIEIKGAAHIPTYERAEAVTDAMRRFLDRQVEAGETQR